MTSPSEIIFWIGIYDREKKLEKILWARMNDLFIFECENMLTNDFSGILIEHFKHTQDVFEIRDDDQLSYFRKFFYFNYGRIFHRNSCYRVICCLKKNQIQDALLPIRNDEER